MIRNYYIWDISGRIQKIKANDKNKAGLEELKNRGFAPKRRKTHPRMRCLGVI